MKVRIRNYPSYFGPYQVVEKIFFWKQDTHQIGDKLADTWIGKGLIKLSAWWGSFASDRRVSVKIDRWDTWNIDSTLAPIIVPLLRQLKETAHGAPGDMKPFSQTSECSVQYCFDFYSEGDNAAWAAGHEEWKKILDEMIWAFEQYTIDWESQYHSGVIDYSFVPANEEGIECENGEYSVMKRGPNDTHKFDSEGYMKHLARMKKGTELFGKYYGNLWD